MEDITDNKEEINNVEVKETKEDKEKNVETPIKENPENKGKNDKEIPKNNKGEGSSQSLTPQQIKSLVKSEISTQMGKNRSTELSKQRDKTDLQNTTKKPLKAAKGKSKRSSKTNGSMGRFFLSYDQLIPINVNKNSVVRFPQFNGEEINNLLNKENQNICIVSVVLGKRDVNLNMNYSLQLQRFLIRKNYFYLPLYLMEDGKINDIIFIVISTFPLTEIRRNLKLFISKYFVNEFISLEGNSFVYETLKQRVKLNSPYYQNVILYYCQRRGINVQNQQLRINTQPITNTEIKYRMYNRKELCVMCKTLS